MKNKEWNEETEEKVVYFGKRIERLEEELGVVPDVIDVYGDFGSMCTNSNLSVEITMNIELPEMQIEELHFNRQFVPVVFEFKEGIYYSRDIFFNSARNTDETECDLLSKYLNSEEVQQVFIRVLNVHGNIQTSKVSVFVSEESQGVKKYNGVKWWYWLKSHYSGFSFAFRYADSGGFISYAASDAVSGVALAFSPSCGEKERNPNE